MIDHIIINRTLNIKQLVENKSYFLFGPRGIGKSSLIKHNIGDQALIVDLLRSAIYIRLMNNPSQLESMIALDQKPVVVIDEIQRVPELLNEVHRLIEKNQTRFLLTGSSVRKLKKQGVNLLAGRARREKRYYFYLIFF
ncbi:MAG: AAA family ATPase [Legionellaceae bacterium]|nr:AAA family ATPase [Legionellaceae bacterium]